jgi:hypothetical protein
VCANRFLTEEAAMRRTSLLLGAVLAGSRTISAQNMNPTATPPFRAPAQTAPHLAASTNPVLAVPEQAAKAPAVPENLTSFDGARAELVWRDWNWKLVADGVVIKEFGRRESEARQALRLIRGLHLTEHGTIGSPAPVMEYWLSDGQAPQGLASGVRPLALDPTSLKAEQREGQWVVRDKQRVWFNFGLRGDEAQQALTVMQKYGFTQAAMLGNPLSPTMMVFTANPVQPGSGSLTFKAPHGPAPDASAAIAGYVPTALPPLAHAATQPNQPTIAFNQGPVASLPARTTWLRAAPPEAPGLTERVSFDWRQAQVRQEHGRWKLEAGSHVLGDFGTNQHAAAEALKAVQYYRFTEQCQVGQPTPYCTYFLVGGQAPHGIPFGVQGQRLDVDHLQVQKLGDNYALTTAGQPVMQFGPRPDEARHMYDAIKRYRFDSVCHFGGPEETGMTFLVQAR